MAKKVVGIEIPDSVRKVSLSFIKEYFTVGLASKAITQKQYKEWVTLVKNIENGEGTPQKKTAAVKRAFINMYLPQFSNDKDHRLANMFENL